jgi:cytochrome c-type biogenesis protein CcmH
MTHTRRGFLGVLLTAGGARALLAQESTGGDSLSADPLRQPWNVGIQRDTVGVLDNDPVVIAIERRLRCTCGCTLDMYTCRTTDFTCTYSPALHKEVVAMIEAGKTPEEIIAFYVARDGEAVLMAPPAEGFNIAGYLVPGLVIATVGLGLGAYLSRRRDVESGADAMARPATDTAAIPAPDAEAAERLRRALDEVES